VVLTRTGGCSKDRALAGCRDPDRDDGGDRDHPPGLAELVEGGIEPHVGALCLDRSTEEGPDLFVEHLADPGDLRAGDAVDPERPDQVVDLASGYALHVGLHHDRVQRALRPPAGLEQRGEVGARGDLGDPKLDRAHARVPASGAIAVAVGDALGAALVRRGADLGGDLGLHHRLGEHPDTFA